MKSPRSYLLLLIIAFVHYRGFAQNNSSPYSILGIGDIEESHFNRVSGMANTGIAYRSSGYLINNNPAAYSELSDQIFFVEAAARASFISYYGTAITSENDQTRDFAIERFSLGIRVNKFWGSSVGFMPYSTANYSFTGLKSIQGSNISTPADYEGNGGVNQFYWGNGFKITKHFSIGVNLAYLNGTLSQKETIGSTSVSNQVVTTKDVYLRNFYPSYGMQFYHKLNSKWDFGIGATYAYKKDLKAEYTSTVTNGTNTTISDNVTKDDYFTLPNTTGVGIALTKNKKTTFVADYRYQAWSDLNYKGFNYYLQNSSRLSAGIEISKKKQGYQNTVETVFYQAGLFYSNSYLNVNNEQLKDMGFSIGMGFNSKRNALGYCFAFEYGIRGTQNSGLIQEKYGRLTITLSYRDFWLTKGRKYY
ncbi:MAG: hypothetical protein C5B52_13295 [Bacteroidetes bacterium]|nr:MAG: hypothetical protein C5B52_13295 [Bacteroidota bacterium]